MRPCLFFKPNRTKQRFIFSNFFYSSCVKSWILDLNVIIEVEMATFYSSLEFPIRSKQTDVLVNNSDLWVDYRISVRRCYNLCASQMGEIEKFFI